MPEPQRKSFLRRGGEIFANLILEEVESALSLSAESVIEVAQVQYESNIRGSAGRAT